MKHKGVNYIELPMEKNISAEDIPDAVDSQKFLEIMNQSSNLPVLLHDSTGRKRVAYLAAIWMLKSGKFNYQQTFEKIKQIRGKSLTERETAFLQSITR